MKQTNIWNLILLSTAALLVFTPQATAQGTPTCQSWIDDALRLCNTFPTGYVACWCSPKSISSALDAAQNCPGIGFTYRPTPTSPQESVQISNLPSWCSTETARLNSQASQCLAEQQSLGSTCRETDVACQCTQDFLLKGEDLTKKPYCRDAKLSTEIRETVSGIRFPARNYSWNGELRTWCQTKELGMYAKSGAGSSGGSSGGNSNKKPSSSGGSSSGSNIGGAKSDATTAKVQVMLAVGALAMMFVLL